MVEKHSELINENIETVGVNVGRFKDTELTYEAAHEVNDSLRPHPRAIGAKIDHVAKRVLGEAGATLSVVRDYNDLQQRARDIAKDMIESPPPPSMLVLEPSSPIEALGFEPRILNPLKIVGIDTVGQLTRLDEWQVANTGVGHSKLFKRLITKLDENGLTLSEQRFIRP